ncbi:hypothetical protein RRSWK_04727 [Rhodopirellula sp. SWK7]|nr:hypothetical protein RRSWK_04727 [Rhodopirellula sp. SWK7]
MSSLPREFTRDLRELSFFDRFLSLKRSRRAPKKEQPSPFDGASHLT